MMLNFVTTVVNRFSVIGAPCGSTSNFLAFPTWYKYLPGNHEGALCSPSLVNINGIWLIGAAIIEILLRIAALMAVGFIIYGGIEFMTSQGNPQQVNSAKGTIISAAIGLVICLVATVIVSFVAGSIT
jgi:hypothetical protein